MSDIKISHIAKYNIIELESIFLCAGKSAVETLRRTINADSDGMCIAFIN